jgi:hypothetical protein
MLNNKRRRQWKISIGKKKANAVGSILSLSTILICLIEELPLQLPRR